MQELKANLLRPLHLSRRNPLPQNPKRRQSANASKEWDPLMKTLFLRHFAATVAPRILAKVKTPLAASILDDEGDGDRGPDEGTRHGTLTGHA